MEHSQEWRMRIRDKRFEVCNREWLEFMQNGEVALDQEASFEYFDDNQPHYSQQDYMQMHYMNDLSSSSSGAWS